MIKIPKDKEDYEESQQIALAIITGLAVVLLEKAIVFIINLAEMRIITEQWLTILILCVAGLLLIRDYQKTKIFSKFLHKIGYIKTTLPNQSVKNF